MKHYGEWNEFEEDYLSYGEGLEPTELRKGDSIVLDISDVDCAECLLWLVEDLPLRVIEAQNTIQDAPVLLEIAQMILKEKSYVCCDECS